MDFGVAGVGYATAIANYIAFAFGISRVCAIYPRLPCVVAAQKDMDWSVFLDPAKVRELLVVQGNVFLRSLFVMYIVTDFNAYSASLGAVPLAANNLLMQLQMFISYGADGFANAAEALVGKATGMGSIVEVRKTVAAVVRWSVIVIIIFTLVYVFVGRLILECLTSHIRIVEYATGYLRWQWIAPVASVAAYILDGIFVGANCFRQMRDANFFGFLIFVLLLHTIPFSNDALWGAFLAHLLVRAGTLMCKYPQLELTVMAHGAELQQALLARKCDQA